MIVAGVIGEGVFEAYISEADGLLQNLNDTRLIAAQREAEVADVRSASAYDRASRNERETADANTRTARLAKEAEELNKRNLETEARLEEERKTRLELEEWLAPRGLNQNENVIAPLRPFKGTKVILEYLVDAEVRHAAGQIRLSLRMAGWPVVSDRPVLEMPDEVVAGVEVISFGRRHTTPETWEQARQSEAAVRAFVAYLKASNWYASEGVDKSLPADTIKISVMLKPSQEQMKAAHEQEKREQIFEQRRKEIQERIEEGKPIPK
jgi:hypothetical protein